MVNFELTPEIIKKAKGAKSALELITIAKAEGIKISTEEAKAAFAQINPKTGELDDVELDNVSGGACDTSLQVKDGHPSKYFSESCVHYEENTLLSAPVGTCEKCIWWDNEHNYRDSLYSRCLNEGNRVN